MKINKEKLKEWWSRYWFAELISIFFAVIFWYWTFLITKNEILSAYMWTLWDTIWYYWTMIFKEFFSKKYSWTLLNKFKKIIKNLLFEFWPSEIVDFFMITPFFLYFIPKIIWNYPVWIILWKIISNIIFYLMTIYMYEIRKKHFKNK